MRWGGVREKEEGDGFFFWNKSQLDDDDDE